MSTTNQRQWKPTKAVALAELLSLEISSVYRLYGRHKWPWLSLTTPAGGRGKHYWVDAAGAEQWFIDHGRPDRAEAVRHAFRLGEGAGR